MGKGFSQDSKNEDQDKNSSLLDRSLLTLLADLAYQQLDISSL